MTKHQNTLPSSSNNTADSFLTLKELQLNVGLWTMGYWGQTTLRTRRWGQHIEDRRHWGQTTLRTSDFEDRRLWGQNYFENINNIKICKLLKFSKIVKNIGYMMPTLGGWMFLLDICCQHLEKICNFEGFKICKVVKIFKNCQKYWIYDANTWGMNIFYWIYAANIWEYM